MIRIESVMILMLLIGLMSCGNEKHAVLVGKHPKTAIVNEKPYKMWFEKFHRSYQLNENLIDRLRTQDFSNIELKVVLGTWCHDSQREVPRLLKILDAVDFPEGQLDLLFVDEQKKEPNDLTKGLDIERVPTIIVYSSDSKELGRIIETPKLSLEEDLISILNL